MKAISIIFINILTILISMGCYNKNPRQIDLNHNLLSDTDTMIQNTDDTIFSTSLKYAINEYIDYMNSFEYTTPLEENVSVLYFYSEDEKDFLLLSGEPYYSKKMIKGYKLIGKYLFVYYGRDSIANKYIDTDKFILYHDTIPGFRAYEDVPGSYCDASGTIFEIINPDSLVLIEKGML